MNEFCKTKYERVRQRSRAKAGLFRQKGEYRGAGYTMYPGKARPTVAGTWNRWR